MRKLHLYTHLNDATTCFTHNIKKILFATRAKSLDLVIDQHLVRKVQLYALVTKTTISALYRSHDITKTKFLLTLKKLIVHNSKFKNNLIMEDFNIDISNQGTLNEEFLHILLEHGYCQDFCNITRPSDKTCNSGTCIDNIFIKLDKIAYRTFTLRDLQTIFYSLCQ